VFEIIIFDNNDVITIFVTAALPTIPTPFLTFLLEKAFKKVKKRVGIVGQAALKKICQYNKNNVWKN